MATLLITFASFSARREAKNYGFSAVDELARKFSDIKFMGIQSAQFPAVPANMRSLILFQKTLACSNSRKASMKELPLVDRYFRGNSKKKS